MIMWWALDRWIEPIARAHAQGGGRWGRRGKVCLKLKLPDLIAIIRIVSRGNGENCV